MPRGLCVLRTLAAYALPTTSCSCASLTFGARTTSGINPYRLGRFSRGQGSERIDTTIRKRQLGLAGALVWQGDLLSLSKEVMFGRLAVQGPKRGGRPATLGWTASRKISRPSGRSRAKAKDGSGPHSELLSRLDGIERLLRKTWAFGTQGSRGERKHSIASGDARTFANPTCGASARLVNLFSSYVGISFRFALLLLFLRVL